MSRYYLPNSLDLEFRLSKCVSVFCEERNISQRKSPPFSDSKASSPKAGEKKGETMAIILLNGF
jgi:hypothetical protein